MRPIHLALRVALRLGKLIIDAMDWLVLQVIDFLDPGDSDFHCY